jgi:hypothetical protein
VHLEASTRLWDQNPDAMRDAPARHDDIGTFTRVALDGTDRRFGVRGQRLRRGCSVALGLR